MLFCGVVVGEDQEVNKHKHTGRCCPAILFWGEGRSLEGKERNAFARTLKIFCCCCGGREE